MKCFSAIRLIAELGHIRLQVGLVKKTHDDLLAKQGREAGNTEVHVLSAAELDLDATVLGQTTLGNIQLGHDLDTGGDGIFQLEGRFHDLIQDAVNAVTHPEHLLVRLDMDIAGFFPDGILQDGIDHLDNRCVFSGPLQRADIDVILITDDLQVFQVHVAHDIGQRGRLVIMLVDGALDVTLGGDHHLDIVAGHELDIFNGNQIGRITDRNDQRRSGPVNRYKLILLDDFRQG